MGDILQTTFIYFKTFFVFLYKIFDLTLKFQPFLCTDNDTGS